MKTEQVSISEVKPNNIFNCLSCGSEFVSKKGCATRTPKYCTKKCYAKSLIKEKPPKVKFSRKGFKLSDEWKKALSEGRKKSEKW